MTLRRSAGTAARTRVRWGVQHGVVGLAVRRAARQGDLQASSIVDPSHRDDPYPLYGRVRARGPLVPGRLGHVTATHAVASEVLRSEDFRAGTDAEALPRVLQDLVAWSYDTGALGPIDPPSLLVTEPPDHTRHRRLVSRVFTARAVEGLRDRVQQIADGLLDELEGQADLVTAYCSRLPVTVITEILGVRPEDHEQVLAYGRAGAPSLDVGLSWRQFREVDTAIRGFSTWLGGHLQRLRADPGTDLLSQLVVLEDDGQRLDDTELRAIAGLVLAAGFETTVNLLGSGTVLLLQHPEQRERLHAEPGLWSTAVDEVLRYESPVQLTARFAVRDTEVAGQRVRRGGLVSTMLGGANRDPAAFDEPDRFDVGRPNARDHLSFSAGRHFCLGASLARLEGEVGLRSLLERYPDLALAPGARRTTTRVLRGWEALPVRTGRPAPALR
ncbi:MAG: cytochrome [Frankiales bacterium]|nr:cytochrome [Frankiales bacterium]